MAAPKKKKHSLTLDQPHVCPHCDKAFSLERTLMNHVCEKKRRALQKDEKRVKAGFMAFNMFHKISQGATKDKSYEVFCDSQFYNIFVKFGSLLTNTNPLYPEKFIEHLIKTNVKIDNWCKEEVYTDYLIGVLKVEPADAAIQRSIITMMDWADEHGLNYEEYFRSVSTNRLVHHVVTGAISCWILLNCKSGKDALNTLNDEQLNMIGNVLDLKYWIRKFKSQPADTALAKEICKEAGIK